MKIIFILIVFSFSECRSSEHLYKIKEELPINEAIGYLNNDIPSFRNGGDSVRYKILNTRERGVICFILEETTSKLSVVSRIDRESQCTNKNVPCYITLKVSIIGTDRVATVKIEIEDVNDHSPSWQMAKYKVSFKDGDNAGSRMSLPLASDADAGENGEVRYSLEGPETSFILIQEHGLYLQSSKELDREARAGYEINVIAVDRGSVVRSSRLQVEVEIIDVNDNSPRFTTSVFRPPKFVPETIAVGTVVLTLTATDADSGSNGEFSFTFSPTETSQARSYFFLKSNGDIVVQRQLDYDNGQEKFDFKVVVKDHASPGYERSSESRVEIVISDENDEQPSIAIYPMNTNLETAHVTVDENKPPMTTVALLHTSDKDFKGTDSVTCSCKTHDRLDSLSLVPSSTNNDYKLVTSRPFDRESELRIIVNIRCIDSANHFKSVNVTVEVTDLNDNAPKFSDNVFHLYVKENKDPGTKVRNQVRATDPDDSDNGLVEFSISNQEPFTIESRSGILRTKDRLDRERTSSYQFLVIAKDHGKKPLSSSATVVVHVEDENDNPVLIEPFPSEFRIHENLPSNSLVGRIVAKDGDNQTIIYYLDTDSEAGHFKIDRHNGAIFTKTQLDREKNPKFQFKVFVTDKQHTASIVVTVFVEDTNDNSPKFTMPNRTHNSITVSLSEAAGFNLAKIQALDDDDRENAQIQYSLGNNKNQNLFSIDKDSGVLYLESNVNGFRSDGRDFYSLELQACDMGTSRRCTLFKEFKIYFLKSPDDLNMRDPPGVVPDSPGFNENIIVGLIGFLLMMILVTIVVIICLRRRARGDTKTRSEPHPGILSPNHYSQSQNDKSPFETDQCSVEICELTNRLSPDQEMVSPLNQFTYYNIGDQYQSGNLIPISADHTYHVPFIATYQPQLLNPRTMQRITDNIGYYSKYDMKDNNAWLDDQQTNFISNEIKPSIISSNYPSTVTTPSQKCKKLPGNTVRKPQTSFV